MYRSHLAASVARFSLFLLRGYNSIMTMYHTICVAVSFALLSGCTNSETAGIGERGPTVRRLGQ